MAHPVWHDADQTSGASASTSETVARPNNVSEGDELIAIWMARSDPSNPDSITHPEGWEFVDFEASSSANVHIFRKRATASEPADYTFSSNSSDHHALLIGRVTGLSARLRIEAVPVGDNTGAGGGSTFSLPQTTGLSNNDYLTIAAFACRSNSGTHSGVSVSTTGFSEVYGVSPGGGFSAGVWKHDLSGTTAPQVDASNTNTRWAGLYIVLRDETAAVDPPIWNHAGQKSAVGGTTSLTADIPDNVVEGDLLLAIYTVREGSLAEADFTVPSGWTLAELDEDGGSSNPRVGVWYKIATASEPADYTFEHNGSAVPSTLVIGRVVSFDAASPIAATSETANETGNTTSLPGPSALTSADYLRLVAVAGQTSFTTNHNHSFLYSGCYNQARAFEDLSQNNFNSDAWVDYFRGTSDPNAAVNNFTGPRWSGVSVTITPGTDGSDPDPLPGQEPLEITTTSLPGGEVGAPYSETLQATGGTPPYTWAITVGALPSGLSLNTSTGEISGTPDTVESQTFTVQVTDDDAATDTQELTIEVVGASGTNRITAVSVRPLVGLGVGSNRVTAVSVRPLLQDLTPFPPELEGSADGTEVSLATSDFEGVFAGQSHAQTRWQIQLQGGDWSSPLVNDLTSDFKVVALFGEPDGIPANSTIEGRASHLDQEGRESPFSNVLTLETGDALPRPDQPSVTIVETGTDYVIAEQSAFSHAEGTMPPPGDGDEEEEGDDLPWHVASKWEIRLQGGATVLDTGFDSTLTDLEQLFAELDDGSPLDDDTAYEIRVTHQDGKYGTESDPSAWVAFTTDAIPPVRPDKPTITIDVCDPAGIEVSGSVYSHPDSPNVGSAHNRTRWHICFGPDTGSLQCTSIITSDPGDLESFTWPHPVPGTLWVAVEYEDEDGRWSERSDYAGPCEIPDQPPQVLFEQCLGAISSSVLISWTTPGEDNANWEWEGELSEDDGVTWVSEFSALAVKEYLFETDGRENGDYILRVRTCDSVEGICGEWAYLPITIDRTGMVSIPYDFSSISEFPDTWEVVPGWDNGDVTWELVDNTLSPDNVAPVGILAHNEVHNADRHSILRFNELGEPVEFDATLIFSLVPRDTTWYGWRYAYTQLLHGGIAYKALAPAETPEGRKSGLLNLATGGRGTWPFPPAIQDECTSDLLENADACPCGFVNCGICMGGTKETFKRRQEEPDRVWSYAMASKPGSVLQRGWRPTQSTMFRHHRRGWAYEGDRERGAQYSHQYINCPEWNFFRYTMRIRIRQVEGGTRQQIQLLGPGIDPTQGWIVDRTDQIISDLSCGGCGLAFRHFQNLTQDHGVLFHCVSFTNLSYEGCNHCACPDRAASLGGWTVGAT